MKATKLLLATAIFTSLASLSFAGPGPDYWARIRQSEKHRAEAKPKADAQAKAEYPLKTCVVSAEEIGSMGEGIDYVYKQAGKPDRLVRFCCKNCRKDFDKEPAKYLKLIDEAAAKAKQS